MAMQLRRILHMHCDPHVRLVVSLAKVSASESIFANRGGHPVITLALLSHYHCTTFHESCGAKEAKVDHS